MFQKPTLTRLRLAYLVYLYLALFTPFGEAKIADLAMELQMTERNLRYYLGMLEEVGLVFYGRGKVVLRRVGSVLKFSEFVKLFRSSKQYSI